MLIDPRVLALLGVRPTAVLHVGAHHGEERESYLSIGWKAIAWVEPLPGAVATMRSLIANSPLERLYVGAAYSQAGLRLDFHVASNGQSSSLFAFEEHADIYPEILEVDRLTVETLLLSDVHDSYLHEFGLPLDLINLDIQGAELAALRGLGSRLDTYKWIYCEVSTRQLYRGQPKLDDVDGFLALSGFRRVVTAVYQPEGWGDALYVSQRHHSHFRLCVWLVAGKFVTARWSMGQWRRRLSRRVSAAVSRG